MNVLIYGGGAVGLGLASCLLKSKLSVDIVARANTVTALDQHGLYRDGIFGQTKATPGSFRAVTSLAALPPQAYHYIVVCIKSFDSPAAAQDLARFPAFWDAHTCLVLAQNGWGNVEHFAERFEPSRVYNARVITGFKRCASHHVTVTVHADAIHIGSLYNTENAAVTPLSQAIHQGGIPCITSTTIARDLWAKMLFNCTLNPVGAILDVPYGDLGAQACTRDLMNHIVQEIFTLCATAGFPQHWESPAAFLEIFYEQQVPATAQHRSSTLQDIQAGKRTEIDALNGQVIRLAHQYQVEVPYNQTIYRLVKFIESRSADTKTP